MFFFGSSSLVVFTQIRGDRRAPVDTTAAMEQDWLGKPTEGSQGLAHIVVPWPLVVGPRDARDFESAVAVVAEEAPGCRSGPLARSADRVAPLRAARLSTESSPREYDQPTIPRVA